METHKVAFSRLFFVACLAVTAFVACEMNPLEYVGDAVLARGEKVKYLNVDSLQVLPTYTELFNYDATLGEPPDSTQMVQMLVVYWDGDTPYLKRGEDSLMYRANMDSHCLIDRPKPKVDGSDVVLVTSNVETGEASEPVFYDGVYGLRICPR